MRRRYSRFTARLTVAGDTPKDLATRRWLTPLATISMTAASCSSDNRRGAPSFLPAAFAFRGCLPVRGRRCGTGPGPCPRPVGCWRAR